MIDFPIVPSGIEPPVPKMRLRNYALFSEQCLKSNPFITYSNCLVKRASEKAITRPFCLTTKTVGANKACLSI